MYVCFESFMPLNQKKKKEITSKKKKNKTHWVIWYAINALSYPCSTISMMWPQGMRRLSQLLQQLIIRT